MTSKVYGAFYRDPSPKDPRKVYHWANAASRHEAVKLLMENAPLPESWELRPMQDGMPIPTIWEVVPSDPS